MAVQEKLLIVFAIFAVTAAQGTQIKLRETPVELAVLLDTSRSVGPVAFKNMTRFAQDLVNLFDIGPTKTRVAMTLYGTHIYDESFNLDKFSTAQGVVEALGKLQHMYSYSTRVDKAMKYVRKNVLNSTVVRPNVPKFAVVFSDGDIQSSQPLKRTFILNEARVAQRAGIIVIAVEIGYNVDYDSLFDIATGKGDRLALAAYGRAAQLRKVEYIIRRSLALAASPTPGFEPTTTTLPKIADIRQTPSKLIGLGSEDVTPLELKDTITTQADTATTQVPEDTITTQADTATPLDLKDTITTQADTATTQVPEDTITTQADTATPLDLKDTITTQADTATTQVPEDTITTQADTATTQVPEDTITTQADTATPLDLKDTITTQADTATPLDLKDTITTQADTATTQVPEDTITTQADTATTQVPEDTITTQADTATPLDLKDTITTQADTATTQVPEDTITTQADTATTQVPEDTITTQADTATTQAPEDTITTQADTATTQAPEDTITTQADTATTQAPEDTITTQADTATTQVPEDTITTQADTATTQVPEDTITTQADTATTQAPEVTITTQAPEETITTQADTATTQAPEVTITTQADTATTQTYKDITIHVPEVTSGELNTPLPGERTTSPAPPRERTTSPAPPREISTTPARTTTPPPGCTGFHHIDRLISEPYIQNLKVSFELGQLQKLKDFVWEHFCIFNTDSTTTTLGLKLFRYPILEMSIQSKTFTKKELLDKVEMVYETGDTLIITRHAASPSQNNKLNAVTMRWNEDHILAILEDPHLRGMEAVWVDIETRKGLNKNTLSVEIDTR